MDLKLCYAPIVDRITGDRFEEITRYQDFIDNDTLPSRGQGQIKGDHGGQIIPENDGNLQNN